MKPSKSNIAKWCEALRSGKYKQTTGNLQSENGYCCIGVACELFIPKAKQYRRDTGCLAGTIAYEQLNAPSWLKGVSGNFKSISTESLIVLNDLHNLTFDEIADCLEAVYIHEVLG